MNLIAIAPEHIWLIVAMTGIVPAIDEEENHFLYVDTLDIPHIVTADRARELFPDAHEYIARFTQ